MWPVQIADTLRELIGQANLARDQHLPAIAADIRDALLTRFRNGVLVGLSDTTSAPTRPGQRKARLLLEVLRARPEDVLRFTHDLQVPPHLESDRTRPTTQQDPTKDLRAADQRQAHRRSLHHQSGIRADSSVDIGFDGWIFPKSGVTFVWVLDEELGAAGVIDSNSKDLTQ